MFLFVCGVCLDLIFKKKRKEKHKLVTLSVMPLSQGYT